MTESRLLKFLAATGSGEVLLEHEVKQFLRGEGIPVPRGCFIPGGAPLEVPASLTFPLVVKVASRRLASKSEIGGVRTGIGNSDELRSAVADMLRIEGAEGVLVEETAPPGVEVIVGGVIDPQFGPVVMFGSGGLFVELFCDVAFALAPVGQQDALRLISQTIGAKILAGFRGRPPVDMESLLRIVVAVSELIATGVIEEIDLNPVALYPTGAMVLDAKMKRR